MQRRGSFLLSSYQKSCTISYASARILAQANIAPGNECGRKKAIVEARDLATGTLFVATHRAHVDSILSEFHQEFTQGTSTSLLPAQFIHKRRRLLAKRSSGVKGPGTDDGNRRSSSPWGQEEGTTNAAVFRSESYDASSSTKSVGVSSDPWSTSALRRDVVSGPSEFRRFNHQYGAQPSKDDPWSSHGGGAEGEVKLPLSPTAEELLNSKLQPFLGDLSNLRGSSSVYVMR
jgi:hypothetical protein